MSRRGIAGVLLAASLFMVSGCSPTMMDSWKQKLPELPGADSLNPGINKNDMRVFSNDNEDYIFTEDGVIPYSDSNKAGKIDSPGDGNRTSTPGQMSIGSASLVNEEGSVVPDALLTTPSVFDFGTGTANFINTAFGEEASSCVYLAVFSTPLPSESNMPASGIWTSSANAPWFKITDTSWSNFLGKLSVASWMSRQLWDGRASKYSEYFVSNPWIIWDTASSNKYSAISDSLFGIDGTKHNLNKQTINSNGYLNVYNSGGTVSTLWHTGNGTNYNDYAFAVKGSVPDLISAVAKNFNSSKSAEYLNNSFTKGGDKTFTETFKEAVDINGTKLDLVVRGRLVYKEVPYGPDADNLRPSVVAYVVVYLANDYNLVSLGIQNTDVWFHTYVNSFLMREMNP